MTSLSPAPQASAAALAAALGVSVRTARRFRLTGLPFPYAVMWAVLGERELGAIDVAWRGWKLVAGQLVTPDGWSVRPGEVRAIPIRSQQLATLERELTQPRQLLLCASS